VVLIAGWSALRGYVDDTIVVDMGLSVFESASFRVKGFYQQRRRQKLVGPEAAEAFIFYIPKADDTFWGLSAARGARTLVLNQIVTQGTEQGALLTVFLLEDALDHALVQKVVELV